MRSATQSLALFVVVVAIGSLTSLARADSPATPPRGGGSSIGTIRTLDNTTLAEPVDSSADRGGSPLAPAVISQKGAQFSPALSIVCVGQSVEFHNDEDRLIEHNVFSRSKAKPFDLGLYPPPEQKTVTFDSPGPV